MGTSEQSGASGPGSPSSPPLLVLKGSRVREYLQQNQQLLAAPVGSVSSARYNQTWVSSRVDFETLSPGQAVVILMSDAPYEKICPVRHARLVSATRVGSYLDLVMSAEEFVDPEVAGSDCGAGLAAAAQAAGLPAPFDDDGRKMFVDVAPEGWSIGRVPIQVPGPAGTGPLPSSRHDDSETLAWRRTVDFLTSSAEEQEHYTSAFFFRPVSLRRLLDDRTQHPRGKSTLAPTGEEMLWPGEIDLELDATYRLEVVCYNPHRTAEDVARVRLSPDGGGRVSFPDPLGSGLPRLERDGRTQLHLTPRRAGKLVLELAVTPGGEISSFVRLDNLRVLGPDGSVSDTLEDGESSALSSDTRDGHAGSLIDSQGLLGLDDWIDARLNPAVSVRLGLFREFLSPWSGKSAVVAERHASLAFQEGEWAEVVRLLRGREDLSQAARHQRLLATLQLRQSVDVATEAAALSWTGEHDQYFEHLVRLAPDLDGSARTELAERLPFVIWGDDKSCRFLRALMDTACAEDLVGYIADSLRVHSALFGLDSDGVLSWLLAQIRRFDRPSPALIAEMVHWAPNTTRSDEVVELLTGGVLAQLCRRAGIEVAETIAGQLRPSLDFYQRLHLDLNLANLQKDSTLGVVCSAKDDAYSGVGRALATLMELLEAARQAGAAWEGEEVADRIRGLLGTPLAMEPEARMWAEEALTEWGAFLEARAPYRAKLMDEVTQKGLEVGEHFTGCTLHVFTGHHSPEEQESRYRTAGDLLGMPVAVHALVERGPLEGLRPGRDLVVVITRWGGHSDTEAVQDRCKKAKVSCFAMPQHVLDPERVVLELWGRIRGK
ncbi:MAG: hypothetical protein ACYC8U_13215 [Thermoleophilia bacterium]